ncbi:uncharacterized protein DDB_G0283357 isoform X2 [Zeugodacus cucurbitae]|uniref:uncharacterized protein DDB_G0283357 isoform X2 n=1 Tax=Zeugodacus cucurbitae TaxID=28588 RepID=UPI0023D951AE|nr:uncharacterized protein DDB_G0283357 isoform X2 [Zeugodacus cucurbitae]
MGSCTRRHFMLSTCLLQMITIIERQVFDFLGYMWAPILVNFFHIIFIILGFYGAYHFRIKYIITYLIWSFIWIGWNAFLICFYLNVGILDRDSDLLNLGTGSVSWFEVNGYGCKPTYPVNITSDDPFRPIRPERVDDCLLDYTIVEIVQSGVQCALALLGILGAILISYIFLDEDDRFDFVNGDAKSPQHTVVHPMYVSYSSIPTSASASATLLSNKHHQTNTNHQALNNNNHNHQLQIHAQQQLQQQQQQQFNHQQPNNFNSNTFLIHTNSISNNSHSHSHSHNHSQNQSQSQSHSTSRSRSHSRSNSQSGGYSGGGGGGGIASKKGRGGGDGNSNYPNASKNSTLTRILYSPKSSNKIGASTGNTIVVATELLQRQQSLPQTHTANLHGAQHYYDDSTAKADQLYTNSNRRQFLNGTTYQQQQQVGTPNSSTHDNTTSSLSYASLQNSNLNLTQSLRGGGGSGPGVGFGYTGGGTGGVRHVNKKSKHRQSLYSIEFGPSIDTIRSRADTILDYDDHLHGRDDGGELSPKPMTPRRVKRRSVMARGTNSRTSTTSRRSHHGRDRGEGGTHGSSSSGGGTHPRNSTRSSRRKYQQNPVTKLMDQQQLQLQQQQHLHHHPHSHGAHHGQAKQQLGSFQHKEVPAPLTASNLQTLNQEIINNTSGSTVVSAAADASGTMNNILLGGGSLTKTNNNHYHSFRKNIPPDPIYYNTNAQTGLYQQTWQSNSQSPIVGDEPPPTPTLTPTLAGHFNPTYQHSTTNLHDVEHVDELYNNRPPSVRSSYSNFHGTRPLSSYISNTSATENVFAGLTGAAQTPTAGTQQAQQQQQQQQSQHLPTMPPLPPHVAPATPPLYQTNPLHQHPHVAAQQHIPPLPSPNFPSTPPQNIPFGKRTASRESIRSMAFLNSGPPAYNLNYHTPPDSETTM